MVGLLFLRNRVVLLFADIDGKSLLLALLLDAGHLLHLLLPSFFSDALFANLFEQFFDVLPEDEVLSLQHLHLTLRLLEFL